MFHERPLDDLDLVALVIDGKTFGKQEMIIALGITIEGRKIPLGFVESATETFCPDATALPALFQCPARAHFGGFSLTRSIALRPAGLLRWVVWLLSVSGSRASLSATDLRHPRGPSTW